MKYPLPDPSVSHGIDFSAILTVVSDVLEVGLLPATSSQFRDGCKLHRTTVPKKYPAMPNAPVMITAKI